MHVLCFIKYNIQENCHPMLRGGIYSFIITVCFMRSCIVPHRMPFICVLRRFMCAHKLSMCVYALRRPILCFVLRASWMACGRSQRSGWKKRMWFSFCSNSTIEFVVIVCCIRTSQFATDRWSVGQSVSIECLQLHMHEKSESGHSE